MADLKRIILLKGDIETQGYFSEELAKTFLALGHEVLMYDLKKPWESTSKLLRFLKRGETVLISFNFHGMCGEAEFMDEEGNLIWDAFEIPCYNIVVDHPMYYYTLLSMRPKNYIHISIDKEHEAFMKRFFPEIKRGPFLPLAGTSLTPAGDYLPLEKRSYDLVFTGNYAAPERFDKYITRLGKEYEIFYRGMIEELLLCPKKSVVEVVCEHLKREIPEVSEAQLKETMQNITFIDLYVRHVLRRDVVKTLVDAGKKVHVFGGQWDEMDCKHPENLINEKPQDSEGCLRALGMGKISVNVLPWFKAGAHDRIYNSMCNGAISLTDSNGYLDTILKDGENACIYQADKLEKLPGKVDALLSNLKQAQQIADGGFTLAMANQTWENRAKILHQLIEEA